MKVDYHVHLEEGPYSLNWLTRTSQALLHFQNYSSTKHSKEWLEKLVTQLSDRVMKGAFSTEWLDLYKAKAKHLGLKEVGIVDHLYRFKECSSYYEKNIYMDSDPLGNLQRLWFQQVKSCSLDEYITFIEREKQRWAEEGINLKLGIEADYFIGGEQELESLLKPYEWDYVIGSVHFLDGWGFDNPETESRFKDFNIEELYDQFFSTIEKGIHSKLFDIMAHLDNLKVFGYTPSYEFLSKKYKQIAAALNENDVASEINTGLFYRYPVKEACPNPLFLKELYEHDVPLTTSSDSHFPDHLGMHLDKARMLLKEIGYKKILTFDKRVRKEVELCD